MRLIVANSNVLLANEICRELGREPVKAEIKRFADGEVFVEIKESVRGQEVFVIQSTSAPVNDNLMELLTIIDACKRASAKSVTAVLPYFGYARQDRKPSPRTPITAKLVADLLTTAGAAHVITLDLHATQIQGFFNIPVDNIYAQTLFARHIAANSDIANLVITSPDVGGVARARVVAKKLDCPIAIIDKRREKAGVSEVMNIIGDVVGKDCIIIDDIADSAGTLCNAAAALVDAGAKSVKAYITHAVLSGAAVERVAASKLSKLFVTNSIQLSEAQMAVSKIEQISIAPLIAEVIKRVSENKELSTLDS